MSVWLEITRCDSDSRHKASEQTTVLLAFQNSQKFFPELSRVWMVLPCHLDGHTLVARNFHIKAWRVRTMTSVVRTVNLMHAISIYEAHAFGPWRLSSERLNLNAWLSLWMSVSGRESTSSGRLQLSPHICVLERNPIADWTLSGVQTCCWNVRKGASWNSSKLLDTGEGPDGQKVLIVQTDDTWIVERPNCISRRSDGCKGSDFFDSKSVQNLLETYL